MTDLLKKAIVICQWSWKKIQNERALIHRVRFFAQSKNLGPASQTSLTGDIIIKLSLRRRLSESQQTKTSSLEKHDVY